ncbi:Protein of unknown function [Lactobacillus delbrueckii subsp. bulgaricus]
MWEQ